MPLFYNKVQRGNPRGQTVLKTTVTGRERAK